MRRQSARVPATASGAPASKVRRIALAAGLTACLLGTGSTALAASAAPAPGKIRVFISGVSDTKSSITATGAIGDHGTALSIDANGKVDGNGNFEKVTLEHGGFRIDTTQLNKIVMQAFGHAAINQANCSLALTARGTTTIEDGTGAYAGITGKATLSFVFAGAFPKTAKGCDTSKDPISYLTGVGSGSVSFT